MWLCSSYKVDDVSKFLGMDRVWYPFLGEWSLGFVCLDRIADLDFHWNPLPNEGCQLASSNGFAVPITGMMLEMLCGQFGMMLR